VQATLSHYHILEQIGAGGMGVVYRAHDEHLDCDVALKVLPPGELADDAARKRFRKEALALSKVNHPNIAVVHDFDTQDGTDFLVEELIPGLSLSEMLISGPLPEREILNLGLQLAEGLEAAHQQGVIHRDLKPANIRVTPDARLKILDFGLARIVRPSSPTAFTASETQTPAFAGTLPYMSPEQLLGEKLDARTDIWSAGCVLYEMATGRCPFPGSGPALIDAILHQPAPAASKLNPRLSPGLEAIILKCLEKDPPLRYASARDIAVDLHRLASTSSAIRLVPQPRRARARNVVIASALVAVLALAGAVVSRFIPRPPGGKVPASAQVTPSIAVLPFVDMSPKKDQEYFSDGLAEELLNDLAKIPGLQVTARTSSFQFKGKNEDLRTVGQKLNVRSILEGSVRKDANRVRITVQLINVEDGFHLWSETYDRKMDDIFAVQEEIARSVAGSLKVSLLGGRTATLSARGKNAEAYNAYLQGRYFFERRNKENLEKAIDYYKQAIQLDPGYARAWAGLAEARSGQADSGYVPVEEGYRKAREAVERALALDPNLAEAHETMGWIKRAYDWDWVGADASGQRALALEPGNATVVWSAAALASTLGRFEEALALDRRAVELDPLRVSSHVNLGVDAYYAGRLEEAVAALKKALELNSEFPGAHAYLGRAYLLQGHQQEALAEMEREPERIWRLYGLALAYHGLGQKQESDAALGELIARYQAEFAFQVAEVYGFRNEADRAFRWLERAYIQRDAGLTELKGDPLLKSLEGDPRYAAFLARMHLPT
jgi:serine/threonine-protein kinase